MAENTTQPIMDWNAPNLGDALKMFRQRCDLYFSVKDIKPDKQVDHILLLAGEEGLKRYNSCAFSDEADRKKPSEIWNKFEEQLEPRQNFRIARFYLQKFQQRNDESMDDFLGRCRLQAKNCKFRDTQETEERLVEQIITGTRHAELQKELLSKTDKLTLDEALNQGRTHEASLTHMQQLSEMQNQRSQEIDAINHSSNAVACRNCGNYHVHRRDSCPAWGATCSACGRQNHWANVCFTKQRRSERHQNEFKHNRRHYSAKRDDCDQRYEGEQPIPYRSRNTSGTEKIHNIMQEQQQYDCPNERFEQLTFDFMKGEGQQQSVHSGAFATLDITLPNRPGTHKLKAKVDTGAEGNALPLRTFQRMFPECLNSNGKPFPRATRTESTVLRAYNGTVIKQFGSINIPCKHENGDWKTAQFHVVETSGPVILGLPMLIDLKLVTLHCNVARTNRRPINAIQEPIDIYSVQLDRIGNLSGEYQIALRPDAQPVIHAPRKCPINMKENCCLTSSHDKSIQQIKEAISEEISLTYLDQTEETVMHVDASPKGLGAAPIQEGKLIIFASKNLQNTRLEYTCTNIERERQAVVSDCMHSHTSKCDRRLIVESDQLYKPLEILSFKNLVAAPLQLQRMPRHLHGYDHRINYRPGKETLLADGFAKLTNKKKETINLDVKINSTQFPSEKLAEALTPHEISIQPCRVVATDLLHLNDQDFLLVVDYYSKFPFVRKLSSTSLSCIRDHNPMEGENRYASSSAQSGRASSSAENGRASSSAQSGRASSSAGNSCTDGQCTKHSSSCEEKSTDSGDNQGTSKTASR